MVTSLLLKKAVTCAATNMQYEKEHARFHVYVETMSGASAADIHLKLQNVFPNDFPSYSTVRLWCRDFKNGTRTNASDNPRSGRPRSSRTSENIEAVRQLIETNPRNSTRSLSSVLDMNKSTVLTILKEDLHMRKLCSIFVPCLLTNKQKQQRVKSAQEILDELERMGDEAPHLYAVEDETWVTFSPKVAKQENKSWVSEETRRCATPRPTATKKKTLVLICLTANKFSVKALPYGTTVDSSVYIDFLRKTGEKWRTLRSDPTKLCDLSFQADNARPHVSRETQEFLQRRHVKTLYQSPHSPDFNLLDRWVNAHLKCNFKHRVFSSHEEVEKAALQVLCSTPPERFLREIHKLKEHLRTVIQKAGDFVIE